MASFMNKALAYLGLKDIEDDELYLEDYEDTEGTNAPRGGHTVYPDRSYEEPVAEQRVSTTVRALPSEDAREVGFANTRSAVVRPIIPNRPSNAKVHVVAPDRFGDAQEIGDLIKQGNPVIVNLQMSERDLARRMIDFCSGVTYALGGAMEKVAEQVFLLTPTGTEVPPEERLRLQERGLFRS